MALMNWMVVLYALAAMLMDLAGNRISNRYLTAGWLAGAAAVLARPSPEGLVNYLGGCILPILLLFILFYFRMMGAGDIKLLSVLCGMVGLKSTIPFIFCSFLFGSILSIGILTISRSWSGRFRFLFRYCYNYMVTGIRIPYRPKKNTWYEMHFAVPVFLAALAWKGGLF